MRPRTGGCTGQQLCLSHSGSSGQQVCPGGRVIHGCAELPFVSAGSGRVPSASGLQSLPLPAGRVPGQGGRTERGRNEKAWGSPLCTHGLWESVMICVDRDGRARLS